MILPVGGKKRVGRLVAAKSRGGGVESSGRWEGCRCSGGT